MRICCVLDASVSPALAISNILHVSKETTLNGHVSNFHINRTINNKATAVKVMLFLHFCVKSEKKQFYESIKYYYLVEKNTVQAQQWLKMCYSDSAPSVTMIYWCYADFKRSRTGTNNVECSGRPNEVVPPENIMQVLKIMIDYCKLKVRESAEMVNVSTGSASTILPEKLDMKKVFSKYVSHLFVMEQKQQWNDDSKSYLALFTHNKLDFLHCFVMMNETWIHHFTQESNWQSAEWCAANESCLKCLKMQPSASKFMASVFWVAHGIIYIDYLEKWKSVNSDYYIELLMHLEGEIPKNGHTWRRK